MKIGLLGGTFDPVHLGHLRAAETVREALDLELVAFVPSGEPPHRTGPLTDPLDRFAMVCLASASHPQFVGWDIELKRSGPSYTVDTLAALDKERPHDELILVVGSDTALIAFPGCEVRRWFLGDPFLLGLGEFRLDLCGNGLGDLVL